ncbi:hypothetical protein BDW59DRAFT_124207 [Aspergillus cavernicola]|uniref:DUF7721 domain-containing protein n=1 Tax=Aspergillus cavernicola TaxID=176166 RepID=A0ABR4IVD6_9EURO
MSFGNILTDAVKNHFNKDDDNDKDDLNHAVSHASAHASSNEDSSLFSQALSFVKERNSQGSYNDDVDEDHVVNSHKRYEEGGNNMDSRDLGAGAAMQALKMFNSGSGENTGGGKDKNAFIGMAMAQAGKMWEEKAGKGEASGDKQSAVNQAAEMAFKMYMKSQMSGSGGTGGPSGLMGLASKFLK